MLEKLTCDDRIEARVGERERFVDVRDNGLDSELGCLLERRPVDVEPHHVVALDEVLRQRAGSATEVEHSPSAADRRLKHGDALGNEDEVTFVPACPVMLFVALADRAHEELTAAS